MNQKILQEKIATGVKDLYRRGYTTVEIVKAFNQMEDQGFCMSWDFWFYFIFYWFALAVGILISFSAVVRNDLEGAVFVAIIFPVFVYGLIGMKAREIFNAENTKNFSWQALEEIVKELNKNGGN